MSNLLKYLLPQSWSWFITPSGSDQVTDNIITNIIRMAQAPLIAHPLGALTSFIFFRLALGTSDRITFWGTVLLMFWWQISNWERLGTDSYPPREIIWRMILGLGMLIPLVLIF